MTPPENNAAAPVVISYRRTSRPPVKRTRRKFRGLFGTAKTLLRKIGDQVDDLLFVYEEEIVEQGKSKAVHWIVDVEDPWGPNDTSQVVAIRSPDPPPAGTHIVMTIVDPSMEIPAEDPPAPKVARRPPNHADVEQRLRSVFGGARANPSNNGT